MGSSSEVDLPKQIVLNGNLIQAHNLFFVVPFAKTPIFRLPREEIQHCCKRLAYKTERHPENDIACYFCCVARHFSQWVGHSDEGDLPKHPSHCNT
jgi:hypothetical protein